MIEQNVYCNEHDILVSKRPFDDTAPHTSYTWYPTQRSHVSIAPVAITTKAKDSILQQTLPMSWQSTLTVNWEMLYVKLHYINSFWHLHFLHWLTNA